MTVDTPRLANAKDLRLEMGGVTANTKLMPILVPVTFVDNSQTVATLCGMGWPKSYVYGSVGVPDDAHSFVQAYLEAGTGPDAISTKMPLLIWLVFVQYCTSLELLRAISATVVGSGGMRAMFADDWCREILLQYMPELGPKREAAKLPDERIALLLKGEGIEAVEFVIASLHSMIMQRRINAETFQHGYGSLSDLLMRWGMTSDRAGASPDALIRDTLFQLTSNWVDGRQLDRSGT